MSVGQVGHGELAALRIARIAVLGQAFGPVPRQVAQFGGRSEHAVQAKFRDAVQLPNGFGKLIIAMSLEATLDRFECLRRCQTSAARASRCQHERPPEAPAIGRQQQLAMRAPVDGVRFARQLRLGLQQCFLLLPRRRADDVHQCKLQGCRALKRSHSCRAFRDPRRTWIGERQHRDQCALGRRIQIGKSQHDEIRPVKRGVRRPRIVGAS